MLAIVFLVILIFILLAYRGCISIYICRLLEQQKGQLPPGPFSWPLIGALGIDSQAPWETLTKWASQFGPLTSFFYGSKFTVVLSDMETIKSAMKNPAFEGRPLNHSSKLFFSNGIGFAEGEVWKKHRRLVISSLRVLAGSGTPQMLFDNHLKHCGEDLVGALQKRGEISSFDPASLLKHAVAHVMSFLLFKDALTPADPRFKEIIECCEKIFSVNPSTDILNTFPWLRHVPPFKAHTHLFAQAHEGLFSVMKNIIEDRKKSLQAGRIGEKKEENVEEPADFTEAMFREQHLADLYGKITDDEITVMAAELYLAGTEDTTILFRWLVLLLAYYPEVQEKLQAQVDSVIGHSRAPGVFDRQSLVYLEAVLLETMRYSSSMPFPLPHRITKDTQFMSYQLPKDTAVIVNFYALNTSADLWEEPSVFRPERFLDVEGKLNSNISGRVMGFGDGRRNCPGENVAKCTLVVLLATVMQNLSLTFPKGEARPDISRSNGTAAQPPTYRIVATPRSHTYFC